MDNPVRNGSWLFIPQPYINVQSHEPASKDPPRKLDYSLIPNQKVFIDPKTCELVNIRKEIPITFKQFKTTIDYINANHSSWMMQSSFRIVKRAESKLPYSLAFDPHTQEVRILFKKHRINPLAVGPTSAVTFCWNIKQKRLEVQKSFPKQVSQTPCAIMEILSNSKDHNLFHLPTSYYEYSGVMKKRYSDKIETGNKIEKLCFFTNYYPERDLVEYLNAHKLSLAQKLEIVPLMLEPLCALHRNKIVHYDFKPDNILVTAKSPKLQLKLTDFDFAGICNESSPARGSNFYMAPEIILRMLHVLYLKEISSEIQTEWREIKKFFSELPSQSVGDTAVDMWSFGITLLMLISDEHIKEWYELWNHGEIRVFLVSQSTVMEEYLEELKSYKQSSVSQKNFNKVVDLLKSCLKFKPEERITADQFKIEWSKLKF